MNKPDRILVGVTAGVVLVMLAGCQPQNATEAEATGLGPAARVELQKLRTAHEAEIGALQQQYSDVLRFREEALAKCQERNVRLEEAARENAELHDKLDTVKQEIARLQKMLEREAETPQNR
jgi:chromosome segregation ATPase